MAGGQRPALSHLDRQRVRPVGAMARRRLGASPPAAPNGAAEGLLAPHGRFPVAPPDGLARRLVGTGAPAEGHVVHMRARSLDGRVRADAKLQVSRPLVGERRVPLKAVAPVRIRSGLPSATTTTRPLTCRNEGQRTCCVSDGARSGPAVGERVCPLRARVADSDGGLTAQTAPVGSSQVRLGGDSGESGLVRFSCGRWNDFQNDCPPEQAIRDSLGAGYGPARMCAGKADGHRGVPVRRPSAEPLRSCAVAPAGNVRQVDARRVHQQPGR